MRIETTEHARRITVDVTAEGVRVYVTQAPAYPDYITAPTKHCPSCNEHHDPTEHLYCPICTGRHDPGECAPVKSVTTDLRKEARS
jgi:hypothetical protein